MKKIEILKWTATLTLIIGTAVNSYGYYPEGPLILALGGFIWLIVSIIWKEWSLIITNGILTLMGLIGVIIKYYFN
ncbi:hypothetical protein OAD33_05625 [Alphaproteobacteria bacterium]|jgi:hypothetical protein|nr:hypothetical protein [Alphaproteobacteria bacterium]MDB9870533.1 hypothetical protein [Alphaproteobacteria bacterium]|tara:strand:- start:3775 stop:4002 length:228 start_codon:yes stop_codon:yes gene_type:complete